MIEELRMRTTELTITPNGDGTHRIRVVGHGADPVEFTCDLKPFLVARIEMTSDISRLKANGGVAVHQLDMDLRITGTINPDAQRIYYTTRVLPRDECGRERK